MDRINTDNVTESVTQKKKEKERIMNIITTWNLKGGTGKTTTTFNLAATYAAQDKKVLVLDLDMQATLHPSLTQTYQSISAVSRISTR